MSKLKSQHGSIVGGGLAIIAAAAVAVVIVIAVIAYNHESVVTVKVKDHQSVVTTGSDDKAENQYRVYTTHTDGSAGETFVMHDTILHGRVNTADQFGALDNGKVYVCKTYGFRLPLFSHFRNLFDCHPA